MKEVRGNMNSKEEQKKEGEHRREGDGMMGVWPDTSPSVVSPGLKDSGSNGSVDK
jgi:hypothetical protein